MIEYNTKYGTVKIFADEVEDAAISQIIEVANSPLAKDAQIRIMPDVHAAVGVTIGTSIKLPESKYDWRVSPNIVGIDIGCGMTAVKLKDFNMSLSDFDAIVHKVVPSGMTVHDTPKHSLTDAERELIKTLDYRESLESDSNWIERSIGTMGGGNHFIELGIDKNGQHWLTVHSGSRGLGILVAKSHQKRAVVHMSASKYDHVIEKMRRDGKDHLIDGILKDLSKDKSMNIRRELSYLTGEPLNDYLNAMDIAQNYASRNRKAMLQAITQAARIKTTDEIDSVHNYIDTELGIIRKGATSAQLNERLLIPINMRDGMIIGRGLGNADWNYSAPHGAGRILKRSIASEYITLSDYEESMKGVYSSTIGSSTLDESPFVYKAIEDITKHIGDSVEILDVVKPIYNFKAK